MIAIIGAMKIEVDALLMRMTEIEDHTYQKIPFYIGKLAGVSVVVSQSGVAKTNAARSTTVLLEHFSVEGIVNIGTAGGLWENQQVLDVVVATEAAHHDIDVPGWEKGFDPKNPCCFKADSRYVQLISEIISEQDRVWVGPVVSGDCFVCRKDQVDRIKQNYPEALCAEMEAAAIAQVADAYDIPFVVVRSLSDITLKEGNEMTFEEYAQKAAERSAIWCEKFVASYRDA